MHALRKTLFGLGRALVVIASALPIPVRADDEVGRYQMVTLPQLPGSFETRVMILDTRDGHLWQWWQAPAIGSATPGAGIIYLGKVSPGSSTGDAPALRRAPAPESGSARRDRPQ